MSEPSQRPGRLGLGRGLAGPAALVAALLVLVAVASRTSGSGSGGHGPVALPPGVFAWIYAGIVVGGILALPFLLYISTSTTPYDRGSRRRARLAPLTVAAGAGLLLLGRWLLGDRFHDVFARFSVPGTGGLGSGDRPRGGPPPAPETVPLAVVAVLLLAVVGAFAGRRTVARRRGRLPGRVAHELADAVQETLDDLRAEQDPRRAIIRAYARMEAALERSGAPRRSSEAPFEYLARVLDELDVSHGPVTALTNLFEHAKFSSHPLDAAAKTTAIEALEAVHADLEEHA